MGETTVTVTSVGMYDGHTFKKNGTVDLKLKFTYDERANMAKAIAFVSQKVKIHAKSGSSQAVSLGEYNFQELKFDRDGQAFIRFNSEIDAVETENIRDIIGESKLVKFRMTAEIEIEDE